jgi:anaerobic selenocysteine-containing dehydrogenase
MSKANTAVDLESNTEVKNTTCYMCACRCGIRVTLRDGEVRYIQQRRHLRQGFIGHHEAIFTGTTDQTTKTP